MIRKFFINNEYLGEVQVPEQYQLQQSEFWYCPTCGGVYARLPVFDRPTGEAVWTLRAGCCGSCEPAHFVDSHIPGSIWSKFLLNTDFPYKVVQRELILLIDRINKEEEARNAIESKPEALPSSAD